jgi:hypothetical protein
LVAGLTVNDPLLLPLPPLIVNQLGGVVVTDQDAFDVTPTLWLLGLFACDDALVGLRDNVSSGALNLLDAIIDIFILR